MSSKAKISNIVIAGISGAGKDTIANYILSRDIFRHKVTRAVTATTRPVGNNEKDGVDYYFMSNETFDNIKAQGGFAETAEYDVCGDVWKYGSLMTNYNPDGNIHLFILNPYGIQQLIDHGIEFTLVYIKIPVETSYQRMVSRSRQTREQMGARLVQDLEDFKNFETKFQPDIVIDGNRPLDQIQKAFVKSITVADEWLTMNEKKENTSKTNTERMNKATSPESRMSEDEMTLEELDEALLLLGEYKRLLQTAQTLSPDITHLSTVAELDARGFDIMEQLHKLGVKSCIIRRLPSDVARQTAIANKRVCKDKLRKALCNPDKTSDWFNDYYDLVCNYNAARIWARALE